MKTDSLIRLITTIVIAVLVMNLTACTKYNAQKKPWPVGTVVRLNNITLDCVEPLTVDSYAFDDFNEYDGAYHFFYRIHDVNGKIFSHVIDYQLKK